MKYTLKETIKRDYDKYENKKGILYFFWRLYAAPGFRILFFHRIINHKSLLIKFLYPFLKIYYVHITNKYLIEIPLPTQIGAGFFLPHNGPIVINGSAILGEDITIHPNVLIGRNRKTGVPVIGNRVFIGNGAKILGKIHIEDFSFILANSVVTKDVTYSAVVGGIPAKIISDKGKETISLYDKNVRHP